MPDSTCTFTAAAATTMIAFPLDTPGGATFAEHSSYVSGGMIISGANTARVSVINASSLFYTSVTHTSADYDVELDVIRKGTAGDYYLGCVGRVDTAAQTWYGVRWGNTAAVFQLVKVLAGTTTVLGSWNPSGFPLNTVRRLKLEMRGTAIKMYVDAVERVSVTDTDITAVGSEGIYGFNSGSTSLGDTVGAQGDNFAGSEPVVDPPVNTVLPAITGTAAVGQVLTSSTGTWSGAPTSYARQWKNDGVAIVGATGTTYTVQTAEAGHAVTVTVTATNGIGSTAATSASLGIPGPPVFSVAPVITTDGSPATGEAISVSTGTASGSPTFAYQWYRGVSPITGETANGYLLAVSDEGANISCLVTATNGGGSTSASSNTIVPPASQPLGDASGLYYYSGGLPNSSPAASLGGARGGTIPTDTVGSVFGTISGAVAQAGGTVYVDVYVRNTHASTTDPATILYVPLQPTNPGLVVAVAVPIEAAGVDLPVRSSLTTPPPGVTWTTAGTYAAGLAFGDLGPTVARGIHLRLTIAPGTSPITNDPFTIRVESQSA